MTQPARIHPERQRRVKQALQLFSITAWVTGVLLLLLVARMIMQYGLGMNVDYLSWVARVHGFAFVAFLMASLNLGSKARWSGGTWIPSGTPRMRNRALCLLYTSDAADE